MCWRPSYSPSECHSVIADRDRPRCLSLAASRSVAIALPSSVSWYKRRGRPATWSDSVLTQPALARRWRQLFVVSHDRSSRTESPYAHTGSGELSIVRKMVRNGVLRTRFGSTSAMTGTSVLGESSAVLGGTNRSGANPWAAPLGSFVGAQVASTDPGGAGVSEDSSMPLTLTWMVWVRASAMVRL